MQTIELVGEKSVVKFDMDLPPNTAFIEYQGRVYHSDEPAAGVWKILESQLPDGASVYVIEGPSGTGYMKPVEAEPMAGIDPTTEPPAGQEFTGSSTAETRPIEPAAVSADTAKEPAPTTEPAPAAVQPPPPPEPAAHAEPDHAKTV